MYNFQHTLYKYHQMKSMHVGWFWNFQYFLRLWVYFLLQMFHNIKTRFVKVNVTKSIDIIISLPFLRIHYFSLYTTYNNYEIQWISMNSKDFNIVKSFHPLSIRIFSSNKYPFLEQYFEWMENIFFNANILLQQYFLSHTNYLWISP